MCEGVCAHEHLMTLTSMLKICDRDIAQTSMTSLKSLVIDDIKI